MFLSKLSARDMVVLSLLIICSILLIGRMVRGAEHVENDIIYVEVEESVTKEVIFKKLDLAPGEICDYTLIFDRKEVSGYDVTFEFEETEKLDLKKYVYVKMEADGKVFYDKLLADAFEEGTFYLHIDHDSPEDEEVKITYYLPEDVGNEAQKAKSTFKLLVTAVSRSPIEGEEQ